MLEYTIAICNYNMADTLERSLRSITEQVDDRFEILVVDDGSTDDSVAILDDLCEEVDQLRYVSLRPDDNRNLGETRNISVREAKGRDVLLQLDADDVYSEGILDFVEVWSQLRDTTDEPFYLKGEGINIAPRHFLLNCGPYRDLPVGAEDRDLWRRLFSNGAIRWLEHSQFWTEIGYEKTISDRLNRDLSVKTAEFQAGLTLFSCLWWSLSERPPQLVPYDAVTYPLAYLLALPRKRYKIPEGFERRGSLEEAIDRARRTLLELETDLGVEIDRSKLSERGVEIFYDEIN